MIISLSLSSFAQSPIYFSSGNFANPNSWTQGSAALLGNIVGTNILTTTSNVTAGNAYYRFYSAQSGGTTYEPNGGSDILVSLSTSTIFQITGSGKAYYFNTPNTTDNYVFKTSGSGTPGTSTHVVFCIQGAVQTISSVAQNPTSANVFPGQSVIVTATTSGTSTGQNFYLRYTDDAWATSTVLSMAGAGTSYTATIPASTNTASKNIEYYVFSSGPSNVAADGSNADLFTINLNNNTGSNYSYSVQAGWTTTADGNWSTAGTWTANAVPSTTLSMGNVTIAHNVTMDQNATTANLTINGSKTLTINSGSTITTNGSVTVNGTVSNAGTITISSGSWTVSNGGKYQHNQDGGTIVTATWSSGSTCEVTGIVSTVPTGRNQSFHHFTWNCTGQTGNIQLAGTVPTAINGDFTVTSTGGTPKQFNLTNSTAVNLSIGGNFNVNGGILQFATTSGNVTINVSGNYSQTNGDVNLCNAGSGTPTEILNIAGNFLISGGTFRKSFGSAIGKIVLNKTSGVQTVSSSITIGDTNPINFEIGDGATKNPIVSLNSNLTINGSATITVFSGSTLSMGTYVVSGGTFTANSGSYLRMGSTAGITSAGATGNVQTTTRNFNTGANYTYNGSANQATGTGLPSTINTLTIASMGGGGNNTISLTNAGTLTISSVSNSLVLTSGYFSVGAANIVSIADGGVVSSAGGDFASGTAGGTVTFSGTGSVSGTVNFYNVNISNGVNFGGSSAIKGILSVNAGGWVNTNAPSYASGSTLKYNTGGTYGRSTEWSATSGNGYPASVQISNSTTLDLGNGGTGTARQNAENLTIDDGSTLTLNNGGNQMTATLTVGGNVIIGGGTSGTITLSGLAGGDLNVKGDLTKNSGGTLTVNNRAVTFNGTSAQQMTGVTNIDGYLILNNSAGLTVNNAVTITKDLTISSGTISDNSYTITVNGNITNNGIHSGIGKIYLNGASAIHTLSGTGTYQNLEINDVQNAQLSGSCSLNGTLTFTSGTINIGSNNFTFGTSATVAGTFSSSNMFIAESTGEVRKSFSAMGSFSYPVGTTGQYSPISLNFTSGSFSSAYAGVRVTAAKHPDNTSTTDYLNRYWSLTSSGISSYSCGITATYLDTDIAGTESNISGIRRDALGFWEVLGSVNTGGNTISGNITSLGAISGGEESSVSYQSTQAGDWNTASTWVANQVPPLGVAVLIKHAVTVNGTASNRVNSLTIQSGQSLTFGASGSLDINGGIIISGTLDMTSGGTINLGSGGYITNNGTFTAGSGTINFNNAAYVAGSNHFNFNNVNVNANVDLGAGLTTINGILSINTGGNLVTNGPSSYGSSSILKYAMGGTYFKQIEWNSPVNVEVSNNTTVYMMSWDHSDVNTIYTMTGNLTVDIGSTFSFDDGTGRTATFKVDGNVTVNGTLNLSDDVGGDIEIKGNWTRGASGTLNLGAGNGRAVTLNGIADQTINDPTFTTFAYLTINNSATKVVTLNCDIVVNQSLSVEADATLNMSAYKATGGGSFDLKNGATLKTAWIDATDGAITTLATGAKGCIQLTSARTYSDIATYHFTGNDNQKSGNALPSTISSGGKVIIELTSNTYNYTNSHGENIDAGAELEIMLGTVLDNGTNNFSGPGNLTMTGGIYQFTDNVVFGSAVRYPRFSGTYTLSGGTVDIAATLASNQYQYLYSGGGLGVNGYYNLKFSGGSVSDGYKIVPSAIVISNNLTITGATTIVEFGSSGVTGDAGITMDGGRLRMSKVSTSLPELTGINSVYNLSGGTIEYYGTGAAQQQLIRGTYGAGSTRISYYNIELNSTASNLTSPALAGNVDLGASIGIQNLFLVNSPTVFRMDETDYIEGAGNFTLTTGSTLLYGSPNGIKTSGTGVSDGNIRISGTRTFPTDASYGFISDGNMDVGNALPATVQNLYVFKTIATDAVTLQQTTNVATTLTLTSGIITTTSSYKVIVLNNDAVTGISGGGSSSFINGNLQRAIANNTSIYPFPVGDGTAITNYKRADFINNNLVNLTALDVNVAAISEIGNDIDENLIAEQDGTLLNNLLQNAVWTFNPQVGWSAGGSYGVNLYVANTELSGSDDNTFCSVKRDDVSADYADWSTFEVSTTIPVQDADGRTYASGYAQRLGYTTFSKHAIAKSDAVLPIELLSFDVVSKGDLVEINWKTASEINNDYFIIEKSIDGVNFESFAKVDGAGNSNYLINYASVDYSPFKNITYYRLKQIDFDGKYSHSSIKSVSTNNNSSIKVFCNEFGHSFIIVNKLKQELKLRIVDMSGKLRFESQISSDNEIIKLNINKLHLKSGIYLLNVFSNSESVSQQIIVAE
ncbi:MAG: hypothetical protein A2033_06770 [Bacteroidetes bacterium GWA2_31_9]|nr:MAG: hypothetical protein A2033_06770 [Bacteroidetes bacterium GWA2_31_9]